MKKHTYLTKVDENCEELNPVDDSSEESTLQFDMEFSPQVKKRSAKSKGPSNLTRSENACDNLQAIYHNLDNIGLFASQDPTRSLTPEPALTTNGFTGLLDRIFGSSSDE